MDCERSLIVPAAWKTDLGNVFLVSGTVGGAVYYTLKNSLKNEKFKNVSENQFSCSLNECNVLASPIC